MLLEQDFVHWESIAPEGSYPKWIGLLIWDSKTAPYLQINFVLSSTNTNLDPTENSKVFFFYLFIFL